MATDKQYKELFINQEEDSMKLFLMNRVLKIDLKAKFVAKKI